MRVKMLVALSLASAPAMAIEPEALPRLAENAGREATQFIVTKKPGIIAEGVPVDAVLGGETDAAGWVAGAKTEAAALGGLDPISFFEPGGPTSGRPEHSAEYHGSVFYFTGPKHRDLFLSAPEVYAPAFGGYDPELLARGSLLPADPANWTIYDGRLFLSGSPRLKSDFDRHKPEVIKAAQSKWEAVDRMFQDRFFKAHQD